MEAKEVKKAEEWRFHFECLGLQWLGFLLINCGLILARWPGPCKYSYYWDMQIRKHPYHDSSPISEHGRASLTVEG